MIVNSSCQSSNHHHRVKAKHKSPLSQSQSQSIQPSCSPTPPLLCIDRPVQGGGASFGRPEKEKRVFSIGRVKKKRGKTWPSDEDHESFWQPMELHHQRVKDVLFVSF